MKLATTSNRAILRELVSTDFKVRYQGSLLGYAWSLLRPLFLFAILYIVFTKFLPLGRDIEHFPVHLLLGIVLWNFFAEATSSAMTSIVGRGDLIKKINIPKYLVVLGNIFSALINLAINLVVVVIIALVNHVPVTWSWLLVIPLIIELLIFSMACGFVLSVLFVKFRDTVYIWEVVMQAGFYATPVVYALTMVESTVFRSMILMNPMAQIIQDSRWAVLGPNILPSWGVLPHIWLFVPFAIIVVIGCVAVPYFKSQAKYFAENI